MKDPIYIQKPPRLFSASVDVSKDNFLSTSRFMFVVDSPDLRHLSYHCSSVELPAMSVQQLETGYHQYGVQNLGDKIVFEPFNATFMVDEDLENYKSIKNWLFDEATSNVILKRDLSLILFSNDNVASHVIKYVGAFPTSLSSIPFQSTSAETTYVASSVSFSYDYFEFERNSMI